MRPLTIAVAVLVVRTTGLAAQSGNPLVDSAQVAREQWRAASRASAAGDAHLALQLAARAAHAWPTQPAYWVGTARLAARDGNRAALDSALVVLTAMQLGRPLEQDTTVRRLASPAVFQRLGEAMADLAGTEVMARLPDSTVFAEGVDVDRQSGRFYVGSIRHRTVLEVSRSGRVRDLAVGRAVGVGGIFGVRVAPDRVHLWVTTNGVPQAAGYQPGDSTLNALLMVRRSDGAVVRRVSVPGDPRGHVLGDLTIGPAGDIFVTDSKSPWLYRLRPGADTLERFTHPLFRSLQGAAATADGRTLYVADYSHGLLRVNLGAGTVTRLADAVGSTSLGLDGIVLAGGAIVAVQNGVAPARIMRFDLDPSGERIVRARRIDQRAVADEPTIGTVWLDRFVYVANSQWDKHDEHGARIPGVHLSPTLLLAVPLSGPSTAPRRTR